MYFQILEEKASANLDKIKKTIYDKSKIVINMYFYQKDTYFDTDKFKKEFFVL